MRTRAAVWFWLRLGFGFVVVTSCNDSPDLTLLEGADDDWGERRTRMNVVVYQPNAPDTAVEVTPEQFALDVFAECDMLITSTSVGDPNDPDLDPPTEPLALCSPVFTGSPPLDCLFFACHGQMGACTAHKLLEVASTPAELSVNGSRVPPQSPEARTRLYELAQNIAQQTIGNMGLALNAPPGTSPLCTTTAQQGIFVSGSDPVSFGQSIATSMLEAYYLVQESAKRAVRSNLAVADEENARQPSRSRAREVSFRGAVLSRGHAAHLLIGGQAEDVAGELDTALDVYGESLPFSQPRLSAGALIALDAIRAAAPPLSMVQDESATTLTQLAIGDGGGTADCVRNRLLERYDQAQTFFPTDAMGFYEALGIEETDFLEARRWIIDEARAFPRDAQVTLASGCRRRHASNDRIHTLRGYSPAPIPSSSALLDSSRAAERDTPRRLRPRCTRHSRDFAPGLCRGRPRSSHRLCSLNSDSRPECAVAAVRCRGSAGASPRRRARSAADPRRSSFHGGHDTDNQDSRLRR